MNLGHPTGWGSVLTYAEYGPDGHLCTVRVVEAPQLSAFAFELLLGADPRHLRFDTAEGVLVVAGKIRYRPVDIVDDGRALLCERTDPIGVPTGGAL